jgi:hypothetical protein
MSHSVRVTIIASQIINLLGLPVSVHQLESMTFDEEGSLVGFELKGGIIYGEGGYPDHGSRHHRECPRRSSATAACLCGDIARDVAAEVGAESYVIKTDEERRGRCEHSGMWHVVGFTSGRCVAHERDIVAAVKEAVRLEAK